jgi:type VI secretion system protein ImpB
MDGKTGAEQLVERIMNDPELLQSLAAQAKPADAADAPPAA